MVEENKIQQRKGFRTHEQIVYPAHGVGQIVSIEEGEFAETKLELFVIIFEKDKMTLRVPTEMTDRIGMRKLSEDNVVRKAMATLKRKSQFKRSATHVRRNQEYEDKINSGNLMSIAEVVRDLCFIESYNERQLYEAALDRMGREVAAVLKVEQENAVTKIEKALHFKAVNSVQTAA